MIPSANAKIGVTYDTVKANLLTKDFYLMGFCAYELSQPRLTPRVFLKEKKRKDVFYRHCSSFISAN